MAEDLRILIQAALNSDKSKANFESDLKEIAGQMNSSPNSQLQLIAGLNVAETTKRIQSQLAEIANTGKNMPSINLKVNAAEVSKQVSSASGAIQQTVKAISDSAVIKPTADATSINKMVADFRKAFDIVKSTALETKEQLDSKLGGLLTGYQNALSVGDTSAIKEATKALYEYGEAYSKVHTNDNAKQMLADLKSQLNGTVVALGNVRSEIKALTIEGKPAEQVLTSIFGAGKWNYGTTNGLPLDLLFKGTNFEQGDNAVNALERFGTEWVKIQNMLKSSMFSDGSIQPYFNGILNGIVSTNSAIKNTSTVIPTIDELKNKIITLRDEVSKISFADLSNPNNSAYAKIEELTKAEKQLEEATSKAAQAAEKQTVSFSGGSLAGQSGGYTQYNNITKQFAAIPESVKQAENSLKQFGEVSSRQYKNAAGEITSYTVKVKSATGEVEKFRYILNRGTKEDPTEFYQLSSIESANEGVKKLADSLEKAKAKAQQTFESFKNTSGGMFTNTQVYKDTENALKNMTDANSIQAFNNQMSLLEAHAQNITGLVRSSEKSLNPLINAQSRLAGIDNEIRQIKADASGLSNKSKSLNASIGSLGSMAANVNKYKVGTVEWAAAYDKLAKKIASVKSEIKTLKVEQKSDNSFESTQEKLYNSIEQRMKMINSLKQKQLQLDEQSAAVVQKQIAMYQAQMNGTKGNIAKYGYSNADREKELKNLEKELSLTYQVAEAKKAVSSVNNNLSSLNSLNNAGIFTKNANNVDVTKIKTDIQGLISEYTRLRELMNTATPEQLPALAQQVSTLETRFKSVTTAANDLKASLTQNNAMDSAAQKTALLQQKVQILTNQIIAFQNANGKAMKSTIVGSNRMTIAQELNGMLSQLKAGADPALYAKISANFRSVKAEVKALGLEGGTALQTLRTKVQKFAGWMGITMVTATIARQIRGLFKDVAELNTALVDLRKTFKGTDEELQSFYFSANDVAKQLGVTTAEVINQASAWSRLGYNTSQATEKMSKASAMFKMISPNMSMDEATDGLISMMKAFDIESNDVIDGILSKVNAVGNAYATDNTQIVDAMTRSSSAMAAANNTLEETIALNTASIEITRNAETTATAWRTVSMRLRGYDEETQELSDDLKTITGDIADLTKVASNNGQGISLFTDDTKETYKSTYQIIKDISEIWDELSDKNQADLLEKLAGRIYLYVQKCA